MSIEEFVLVSACSKKSEYGGIIKKQNKIFKTPMESIKETLEEVNQPELIFTLKPSNQAENVLGMLYLKYNKSCKRRIRLAETWAISGLLSYMFSENFHSDVSIKLFPEEITHKKEEIDRIFRTNKDKKKPYHKVFRKDYSQRTADLEAIYKGYVRGQEDYEQVAFESYWQLAIGQVTKWAKINNLELPKRVIFKSQVETSLAFKLTEIADEIHNNEYVYMSPVTNYLSRYGVWSVWKKEFKSLVLKAATEAEERISENKLSLGSYDMLDEIEKKEFFEIVLSIAETKLTKDESIVIGLLAQDFEYEEFIKLLEYKNYTNENYRQIRSRAVRKLRGELKRLKIDPKDYGIFRKGTALN